MVKFPELPQICQSCFIMFIIWGWVKTDYSICHIWENKGPLSSFFWGYLRYQGFDHHFSAEICCSFPLPRNPRVQVFLLYLEPRSSSAEAKMEGMQWDNDQEYSIRLVLKKQKRSKHGLKQDWYSYI